MIEVCEGCGQSMEPGDGTYTIAAGGDPPDTVASFVFCPPCATALADEIAANLPLAYAEVLVDAIGRRRATRALVAA